MAEHIKFKRYHDLKRGVAPRLILSEARSLVDSLRFYAKHGRCPDQCPWNGIADMMMLAALITKNEYMRYEYERAAADVESLM